MPRCVENAPRSFELFGIVLDENSDQHADQIDTVDAAKRIDAPLLAIVDGLDERMPEEVVRPIVDAHPGPNKLWIASGVDHVGAIRHPDHATIHLDGWHRVQMNTEAMAQEAWAKAAGRDSPLMAFLD